MATNPTRWQQAATSDTERGRGTEQLLWFKLELERLNSHLRDDAQFIDFTPTNARTPAAHEDPRLLASQPNSSSDNSQFQPAQQQLLQAQQHQ